MQKEQIIKKLESLRIGLKRGTVSVVPFHEEWKAAFNLVNDFIKPATRNAELFHIGSTAIPGCLAKPILDILVVYEPFTDFKQKTEALVRLGFTNKGERGIAGRSFFTFYNAAETMDYIHLHAYPQGHKDVAEKMMFVSELLKDKSKVKAYKQLKLSLIESGISREDYPGAKTDFIRCILQNQLSKP